MLDVLYWPKLLAPQSVTLRMAGASLTGPTTISGRTQVVQTGLGYWEIAVAGIPVGGITRVQNWRAFLASMEGGGRPAYVPAWDYDQAPWPAAGGLSGNTNADATFTGAFKFTGGFGFYNPAIKIYLNGGHAQLATTLTVSTTAAGTIRPGMVFSLLSERLHVIREVLSATSWSIWPALRGDYPTGVRCEFGKPTLKAALAASTEGEMGLAFGRHGVVGATFREVL